MSRISDSYPIKVQPTNDEEWYIVEEATLYLDETIFSSHWGHNQHVDNVIALGKKNTDFLMKIVKENNHPQGMYAHFLIDVLFGLYKDDLKVEGYLGVDGCMKFLISAYDAGLFNNIGKVLEVKPKEIELPYPFNRAFKTRSSIDYKSKKDHAYVEKLGFEPVMHSDCSYSAPGLKGFSLSSYGDWGTFYTDDADDQGREIFLDMYEKGIIKLWRIRIYVTDNGEVYTYDYEDGHGWNMHNGETWVKADDPFVKYNL